jgi:hypothetical protein
VNRALRRNTDLIEVERSFVAYVLNFPQLEEQQSPYVFEGAAYEIWTRIDGTRSEEQIVKELVEATGGDRRVIENDTRDFIAQLLELGLIEESDSGSGV